MSSKNQIHRFITVELGGYLDSPANTTIFDMKDKISGEKTIIKATDVKHITIPQFEGLSVEEMIKYAKDFPEVMKALPIEREIEKLSRQYVANVIHTIIGVPFQKWVDEKVEKRNKKMAEKLDLMVEMDPAIAEIFK